MKLFYDCPIKAAYMAKEFGVQFSTKGRHDVEAHFVYDLDQSRIVDAHVHCRFYVHPDSLHIFEPQVGDLVKFRAHHAVYVYVNSLMSIPAESAKHSDPAFKLNRVAGQEIIQRNNKAFIWPESE